MKGPIKLVKPVTKRSKKKNEKEKTKSESEKAINEVNEDLLEF